MTASMIPTATYRLQFNRNFTFDRAAGMVPYLAELGISHCYSSPCLQARSGSQHGYDIVDHSRLNSEIGGEPGFDRFTKALRQADLGQILDLVPNHMGVGGDDNHWWLDVLENGQASPHAAFFDIDWTPVQERPRGRVLIPLLGDHYGTILEGGELTLDFHPESGRFGVHYYEHLFPVDPKTYPVIFNSLPERFERLTTGGDPDFLELKEILTEIVALPSRLETDTGRAVSRRLQAADCRKRLAALHRRSPAVAAFVRDCLREINGSPGDTDSFDRLHRLLELQAYRLAYWRVAADEINYRRFFNINSLAGLRMEDPKVFGQTHRLVLELLKEGKLQGLRIDHPDGLFDPREYLGRLNAAARADGNEEPSLYLVVEKILAPFEHLPSSWPVHGTTGYDFGNSVNALLVDSTAERAMTGTYSRFTGRRFDPEELIYERKKLIITNQLSSELTVLANQVHRLAQSDRHTRDFTLNGLRQALIEIVACFPVYRTYISSEPVSGEDRRFIEWAVAQATKRNPAAEDTIFNFLRRVLLQETAENQQRAALHFTMKMQQYTAPVMAKGLEDTVLYIYNRLMSLNEVGGDPARFGISAAAFHHANQERLRHWPHAMLATSTHDSKRSEDVRARISVLSEITEEWRDHLTRWRRLNRRLKRRVDNQPAPSGNDEYLFYQNLLGAWPLARESGPEIEEFRDRMEQYMLKAVREAQVHTSWIKPNRQYEDAVAEFARGALHTQGTNLFLDDFLPFQRRVALYGLYNSISQLVLKLTSPGVPDIYQGCELWNFSLVDPDNRRPVDFPQRRQLLSRLRKKVRNESDRIDLARELLINIKDGRLKLYVTWILLAFRRRFPELFRAGDYHPLSSSGERTENLVAFARRYEERLLIVITPRLFAKLTADSGLPPVGEQLWAGTRLEFPAMTSSGFLTNILTGERLRHEPDPEDNSVAVAPLLARFPFAVLTNPG